VLSDGLLTTIDHPDTTSFTVLIGINSSGHIVGHCLHVVDGLFHGFTLIDGEFTDIVIDDDYPGAKSIHALAINARGDIAGYFEDSDKKIHGFLISNGNVTTVDAPGAVATGGAGGVLGLDARELVGTYSTDPTTAPCGCTATGAFIFKKGVFERFDVPSATATSLNGVNTRGDMVGNYLDATGRRHGFLFQRGLGRSGR